MNTPKGPSPEDIATGDPQLRPNDITAHSEGLDCEDPDCQACCAEFRGHEFDASGDCRCGLSHYEFKTGVKI